MFMTILSTIPLPDGFRFRAHSNFLFGNDKETQIYVIVVEFGWQPLSKMHRKYCKETHFTFTQFQAVKIRHQQRLLYATKCQMRQGFVVVSVTHTPFVFIFFAQINDKSRQSKLTAHSLLTLNQSIPFHAIHSPCVVFVCVCACVYHSIHAFHFSAHFE